MYTKESDEWDIPWLYHEKALHNYFIPCHRKHSGQMGRLGVIQLNCTDRWEGSVEFSTAFLHSDWLYFIWNGKNCFMPRLSFDSVQWSSRLWDDP